MGMGARIFVQELRRLTGQLHKLICEGHANLCCISEPKEKNVP